MKVFSQADKEQYLGSLSEADFREVVVRRLFKRLGYHDGRDLCGPEEEGKDSVFFETDRMGVRSLVCVQTKKGSVTLAADANKNLHDLRAQLRTALDSPFKCVQTKTSMFPSKVYLAVSGRINQSARDWITQNISNDPRIVYLDRDDLIRLIDLHCPETWLQIRADVFPYLHALSKLVEDQAIVEPNSASVAGIKSYYAASDAAFVDLKLVRSVSSVQKISGKFKESFEFKEAGLGSLTSLREERLLLLGDAGSGKSTLLIRAAYLMAKESVSGRTNYRVPVILRANDLAGPGSTIDLMRLAVEQLAGASIDAFSTDDLDAGRVILLVDGLDEIPVGDARERVVARLNAFFETHSRNSIVLTTRPYSSIESIAGLRGYTRCRILAMSLATAGKMLSKYSRGQEDSKHTAEILRRLDSIHGIELNPLLVTVFALTSEYERRDIPANITELFSKFTELMLGRWDEAKGLSQQHQARVKEHLVSRFAYHLHVERKTSFSRSDFEVFATEVLRAINRHSDVRGIVEELLVRSGLFRESVEVFEFRHHLIQEYFAGKGISTTDQIKGIVSDEWWRNPIVFYFGSNPDDVQGLLDVTTSIVSNASDACLTIGLALQTCYLSDLDDKIDVWKWVVETLSYSTGLVLAEKDLEQYPIFHFLSHYILSRDAVALSGIDGVDSNAMQWIAPDLCVRPEDEIKRFWALVGLCEIGRVDLVLDEIKNSPLESDHLNLALVMGCYLVEVVRSVPEDQKIAAKEVRLKLKGRVSVLSLQFAKEYRGQLLEYRKGAIVALDQHEPSDLSSDHGPS